VVEEQGGTGSFLRQRTWRTEERNGSIRCDASGIPQPTGACTPSPPSAGRLQSHKAPRRCVEPPTGPKKTTEIQVEVCDCTRHLGVVWHLPTAPGTKNSRCAHRCALMERTGPSCYHSGHARMNSMPTLVKRKVFKALCQVILRPQEGPWGSRCSGAGLRCRSAAAAGGARAAAGSARAAAGGARAAAGGAMGCGPIRGQAVHHPRPCDQVLDGLLLGRLVVVHPRH
jgi:hypothetical protein